MIVDTVKWISPYPIVQVGWSVFEAVEVAAEKWTKLTGAGPFFVARHIPLQDVVHRGKPTTFDHSTALAQWGPVQLELMHQHCDSPSFIRDLCPDRKSRLVSVSWLAPDLDVETARLENLGFSLIWSGCAAGGGTPVLWFDTSSLLGCYLEVFADTPRRRESLRSYVRAAEGWKGERPIRPSPPPRAGEAD